MGRTIVAEESTQSYIENLYGNHQWLVGLIVGQNSPQKDFVVQFIRTPVIDEEVDSNDAKKRSTNKTTLGDVDEQWVAEHASQISRMLPGGVTVIGIFAFASPDVMTKSQAKLRQIIFAIQKTMKKQEVIPKEDTFSERILLQICAVTRKTTCRTVDVSDHKSSFRPAEWKYQSFVNRWSSLQSQVVVDVKLQINSQISHKSSFSKQVKNALQPWCRMISNSLTLVGGKIRKSTEQLENTQTHKKKGQSSTTGPQSYRVQLLSQNNSCDDNIQKKECIVTLKLKGCIHGKAYVNAKATVGEATQALKEDVINSLLSRCELLCDDLRQSDEDIPEINVMPRRVCVQLPNTPVDVSDYMFQDETIQDSLDRFAELLDLQVNEDELQTDIEELPGDLDFEKLTEKVTRKVKVDDGQQEDASKTTSKAQYLNIAVSAAGAMLAVVMSYLLLSQDV
ncbi:protein odr-4 homolog [Glandiceps talaboti]